MINTYYVLITTYLTATDAVYQEVITTTHAHSFDSQRVITISFHIRTELEQNKKERNGTKQYGTVQNGTERKRTVQNMKRNRTEQNLELFFFT